MNVYLDIETIPGQEPKILADLRAEAEEQKAAAKAPANYKDVTKINEFLAQKHAEIESGVDEKWRRTSLNGAYGQIVVIGMAIDDEPPIAFFREDWQARTSEAEILGAFFSALHCAYRPGQMTRPVFVGHNLVNFDLRFIFQRAVINHIRPPLVLPFNAKPWDDVVFDTMTAWAGYNGRISLQELCGVFGLPRKGKEIGEDIDGSKVWDFVRTGKLTDVVTYCKHDVIRARELFKRMNFLEAA